MSQRGQLYTAGVWKVKPGKEAEFIEAWQAFADWTSGSQPGAGEGILLQNEESPQRFLSFGPWESAESIAHWRSRPQFQDFVAKARALCEEMQPQTYETCGIFKPPRPIEPASGTAILALAVGGQDLFMFGTKTRCV